MRVEAEAVVEASREEVWEYVATPSRYREFMVGVTRWEHQGGPEAGLGARYAMRLHVGSADVGGLIEVVEFSPPGEIAWTSVLGIDQRGRWRLRDAGEGRTKVSLRLSYQAPGALFGALADRLAAPTLSSHLRRTLARLKARIEGSAPEDEQSTVGRVGAVLAGVASGARVVAGAGLVRPERLDRLARAGLALARFGPTPAAGVAAAAARYPSTPALIDDEGSLSFSELHARTNALAGALADAGLLEGDGVAVMCRNHRGFVEAVAALSKLGAHALLLNTSFAAPQLADVVSREKPRALVYDQEFAELLADAGRRRKRFVARPDSDGPPPTERTLEELIAGGDRADVVAPSSPGRVVILTSGTTGAPKGATRSGLGASLEPAVALLERIPLRARERTVIAAPLFHSWGFSHLLIAEVLSSTVILRGHFDPEDTLAACARHHATTLAAVPVMIQRILDLPEATRRRYDLSALRVVALSGSALPGDLAARFMDEFGDVLYNLYGSTEVAWAAIAGPEDMRAAPGTAGRAPRGTTLRIVDEQGVELPVGQTGRIFVGNDLLFEGYTGGGTKETLDGLMSTGDVGHLDEQGRLFVEGRDDEMIVSGGENVFPQEVEDLLARHSEVSDVAVVGVEDERFGQALTAFVVARDTGLSERDVQDYVKENLARFKVPREVRFVDELPRNATGKVLKRELVE
jgi:acyl-CoA synthetase (AMP-forming)/AMP-acid ligase II/uncharacterized protein YndB with AHSA1/START domain